MAICKRCGKRGIFVFLNSHGLCKQCETVKLATSEPTKMVVSFDETTFRYIISSDNLNSLEELSTSYLSSSRMMLWQIFNSNVRPGGQAFLKRLLSGYSLTHHFESADNKHSLIFKLELSVNDKPDLDLIAPGALIDLWDSWKGMYSIFVHPNVRSISDFNGKSILIALIDLDVNENLTIDQNDLSDITLPTICHDAKSFSTVAHLNITKFSIQNNRGPYLLDFYNDTNCIAFMTNSFAQYFDFVTDNKFAQIRLPRSSLTTQTRGIE